MKKLRIFAGIGAAAFVATILMTATLASAAPSWAVATAASAVQQDDNMSKLTVTGSGNIPRKTDVSPDAVAGFGWANLDSGIVLVATIHPAFDDSAQNPNSWHLHAARLAGIDDDSFCVQEFYPNPQGGISIKDSKLSVNIENAQMPLATSDIQGAVGFVINPVAASAACPNVFGGSGLQVDVTDNPVPLS